MGSTALLLFLILAAQFMFAMMGRSGPRHKRPTIRLEQKPVELSAEQERGLAEVIRATGRRTMGSVLAVEGELLKPADEAYELLVSRFRDTDMLPTLQSTEFDKPSVMLFPRKLFAGRVYKNRPWLHAALLVVTFATTTWAGAVHRVMGSADATPQFLSGLPYAAALMLILGIHEMGHFLAARIHRMNVSLPYFIPAPFGFGTFGVFIQLREPSANRKVLFDIAIAGPLAGLVVTVLALLIGLKYSEVLPPTEQVDVTAHQGAQIGSSVLFAAMAKLSLGAEIGTGHQLVLHPLAFAGWLGLLITALNLLPIGQLDGGHLVDAMFGPRMAGAIGTAAIVLLFALAIFVWTGLLVWAVVIFFMAGRKGVPPLNDLTALGAGRMALGWFSFILLLLILTPIPHVLYENFGLHCPYL